ncbi:uncharacterized protein LOC135146664 [Zophobas morio]|uniref:uncharacterized protein LOC135146664 n=1 Tax=Zophobas morio TaxID=2755281 RepID=UPI003083E7FE
MKLQKNSTVTYKKNEEAIEEHFEKISKQLNANIEAKKKYLDPQQQSTLDRLGMRVSGLSVGHKNAHFATSNMTIIPTPDAEYRTPRDLFDDFSSQSSEGDNELLYNFTSAYSDYLYTPSYDEREVYYDSVEQEKPDLFINQGKATSHGFNRNNNINANIELNKPIKTRESWSGRERANQSVTSSESESITAKFGNAKSISSEAFNTSHRYVADSAQLRQYDGAKSLSSAQLFGIEEETRLSSNKYDSLKIAAVEFAEKVSSSGAGLAENVAQKVSTYVRKWQDYF